MVVFAKDAPVAGDVHISSTNPKGPVKLTDGKEKPRRRKDGMDNVGEDEFTVGTSIVKVDAALGLVLGWAIVCKRDGADYFDLQDDHIPEDAMLKAAVDFMEAGAIAKEMHQGNPVGSVVFAFPMTTEIAKAFGIESKQTGLLIAMKPTPDVLAKYQDGTYTGFSIGGRRIEDEEVN